MLAGAGAIAVVKGAAHGQQTARLCYLAEGIFLMANELNGLRVAFLVSNEGIEQAELTAPWQAVKDAGARRS
jgi:hypothetical protein